MQYIFNPYTIQQFVCRFNFLIIFMIIAINNTYIELLSGVKLSEIQLYSRSSSSRVKNLLQMLQKYEPLTVLSAEMQKVHHMLLNLNKPYSESLGYLNSTSVIISFLHLGH